MERAFRYYLLRLKGMFTRPSNTPQKMAMGIALGIFVGLTPTVGFQMLPVLLLAIIFRGDKVLALVFTYISNPITVIPIYGLEFYLGSILLPHFGDAKFSQIKEVVVNFSFKKFTTVGFESLVVLWTGGLVLAIPSGVIAYFLFYRIILFYRRQKASRLKMRREALSASITSKQEDELKYSDFDSLESDRSEVNDEELHPSVSIHESSRK